MKKYSEVEIAEIVKVTTNFTKKVLGNYFS